MWTTIVMVQTNVVRMGVPSFAELHRHHQSSLDLKDLQDPLDHLDSQVIMDFQEVLVDPVELESPVIQVQPEAKDQKDHADLPDHPECLRVVPAHP